MKKAIVTVIGQDRVGIIAEVSVMLAGCGINVLDISQTLLQDVYKRQLRDRLFESNQRFPLSLHTQGFISPPPINRICVDLILFPYSSITALLSTKVHHCIRSKKNV